MTSVITSEEDCEKSNEILDQVHHLNLYTNVECDTSSDFLNQSHENEEYQLHTNVDYETSSDFLDQSYTHEQYRISSDFLNQSHSTNVDYNENNGLINDQSVFETGCQIMDYSDDYMVILRNYNNFKNKLNVVLNII